MSHKNSPFQANRPLNFDKNILDFSRPRIMGILNVTPDSFFDGGKYAVEEDWILQTRKMLEEGADVIDLGAVSTRPGAPDVPQDEELKRLLQPLKLLRKEFPEALFSVDTFRSEVAAQCLDTGATMINDISGGQMDPAIFKVAARFQAPYILMHMLGTPQTMQQQPLTGNVVNEVLKFFKEKVNTLEKLNVKNIILDPGFGFGKTLEGNYLMLQYLEKLRLNNIPILVGISRKSMIYKVLQTSPDKALNGTTALHTIALLNGANILRVHDVKEAREAIELTDLYRRSAAI